MEVEVSATEENRWTKDGNTTVYRKSIPLDSQLGQSVLNETAIRYPQFKPKYIDQIRECPDAPYDMVAATIIGPEGLVVSILDENGIPSAASRKLLCKEEENILARSQLIRRRIAVPEKDSTCSLILTVRLS